MNEVDNILEKFKPRNKARYEAMLFNHGTTLRTDFRHGRITESKTKTKTLYKERPRRLNPAFVPIKDTQTMRVTKRVPFDLFIKPKEIVRTDPRNIQKYQEPAEDLERDEARKTRPRVVMTPAVKMDDADQKRLETIIKDTYTTTTQKTYTGFANVAADKSMVSPLVPVPAPANLIKLEKYLPRMVPPEWRIDSVGWDGRQLRSLCQPTLEFWTGSRPKDQLKGKP